MDDASATRHGNAQGEGKGREREGKGTDLISPDGEIVASKPATPPCPHDEIIGLYHEILPQCPQVREWTPTRQKNLRSRWREKQERQSLEWWRRLFVYIRDECPFLTGKVNGSGQPFLVSLDWLVKPENLAKVTEGRYQGRRP